MNVPIFHLKLTFKELLTKTFMIIILQVLYLQSV